MKLDIQREQLLGLLQTVIGVVERRQTLPILSNVLVVAEDGRLALTATDLEVELTAKTSLEIERAGKTTLPARKLLDILRALPEQGMINLTADDGKATLRCGRSRFALATLPAEELPTLDDFASDSSDSGAGSIRMGQALLKALIERSQFAMAQQDVRYYLNGLLLEVGENSVRAVATDGHRLALCDQPAQTDLPMQHQIILPRKGVQELQRLLSDDEAEISINITSNHIQVALSSIRFTSKLIDGKFPDYRRAVPQQGDDVRVLMSDRVALRDALTRTAILANENRGVRMRLEPSLLQVQANNPEQEEAEEEIEVDYTGEALEIGFNVSYLLDALAAIEGPGVKFYLSDPGSSCLLRDADDQSGQYVISPMRL